ncbi:hypothetical protein V2J09_005525 [Rumex salicifolius]
MDSKSMVLAAVLMLIGIFLGVESLGTCNFPAIYNFGDSNSDTGAISAAIGFVPLPNGETFFHKPAGRACDGPENLGVPYLSPYLDSIGTNFRHGANFATGGSSIRPGGYSPFHLGIQINQFIRFKSCTTELYKQHGATGNLPRPDDFSKALYIFDIGQNDLSYGFQYNATRLVLASLPDILSQFTTALQELYKEGARNFWIHNTGPVGCLPYSIIYHEPKTSGLDQIGCVDTQNYVARAFNRQLKERLDKLTIEHPQASFTYFDMYTAKYELFSHAKKQGLKDPFAFCCGSFYGYHINCGQTAVVNGTLYGKPCRDPSKYVSWDGIHNTEASNKKLTSHIIGGSLSTPSRAIGNACSRRTGLVFLLAILAGVESREACKFPAIYMFGDSNSDTGGFSAAFGPVPPPSGQTHGANFAISGASILPGGFSPIDLGVQISQFVQFKSRTIELYKQSGATGNLPRPEDFSKALYIFDIGQNDLSYGLAYTSVTQVLASLPDVMSNLTTSIQELYSQGARNFWIHNTGPIGCLPGHVDSFNPKTSVLDRIGCVETHNSVAREFNRQLKQSLDQLIADSPQASFTHFDMYTAKYELFSDAKEQGLNDPFGFCCCTQTNVNGTIYRNPCPDPSKYISWDGTHNAEASNRKIASHIIGGSLSTPSRAIGNACTGLVFLLAILAGVESREACKFPAIYMFGDSNSDKGGFSAVFSALLPPNGVTFFHKPAGRLCDGRLVIDFIGILHFTENLGMPYLSPYLSSIGTNFRNGANFAISGASILPGGFSPIDLGVQISQFVQFKSRTIELYKQSGATGNLPRPEDFSEALYIFDIGQNDLSYGPAYTSVTQVLASLPDELYSQGARNFWIHNTGPIGCLPGHVDSFNPKTSVLDRIGCVETHNSVAREFNHQLKESLDQLIVNSPQASFTHFDMYTAKYELFSNAKKQGLNDPFRYCCCKQTIVNGTTYEKPCPDPSKYVSWDGVHNAEASNRKIASHIIGGSLSTPSRAIGNACSHKITAS